MIELTVPPSGWPRKVVCIAYWRSFVHRSHLYQSSSYRAAGKPERLLRASVTAFCSLPRPTRREIQQLDDLAVPLLGSASDDCVRYLAAALSDLPHAPPTLIRRLADHPVDISAPILMRSPVLSSIDLVALIGRHGVPHARAIAGRKGLDERIARLIRTLGILEETCPDKAEETRSQLRAMMRPASGSTQPVKLRWENDPGLYRKLRSTALAAAPALFESALASALDIPVSRARDILSSGTIGDLTAAFRALSLTSEEAFLLVHTLRPGQFPHPRATASFLEGFEALSSKDAATTVERWRIVEHGLRAS